MQLEGIGPSGATWLLAGVADITRFPDRGHFASWNGTAPIDASSGDHVRHRLSRAGNRQINRVLRIMAVVRSATRPRAAPITTARPRPGRRRWKPCAALKRRLSGQVTSRTRYLRPYAREPSHSPDYSRRP